MLALVHKWRDLIFLKKVKSPEVASGFFLILMAHGVGKGPG